MDDRAVSSTNAVEEQVGHTMFPLRFTEAVVNSVERARSHPSIGESWLFVDLIEVDNMKVMWTGGRNLLMPTTSTLDCSTKGGEGERENRDCNNNDLGRRSPWWGGGRKEPLTSNHLQSKEEERRRQRRCGSPGYSYPQGNSP